MEQHPVPQNITSFQFRLIGDMTVKQFAYLASGVIGGYACYKMLPLPVIFTVPLAATSVLLGFGLAFVPIEERPMDIWVGSFLRSIYAPTLYIWHRRSEAQPVQNASPRPVSAPTAMPHPAMPVPARDTPAVAHAPDTNVPSVTTETIPAIGHPVIPQVISQPAPQKTVTPPMLHEEPAPTAQKVDVTHMPPVIPPHNPLPPEPHKTDIQTMDTPPKKHASPIMDRIKSLFSFPAPGKNKDRQQEHAQISKPHTPTPPPMIRSSVVTQKRQTNGLADWISQLFSLSHASKPQSPHPAPPRQQHAKPTATDSAHIFSDLKAPSVTGLRADVINKPEPMKQAPDHHAESIRKEAEKQAQSHISNLETQLKQMQTELTQKNATETRLIELQKQLSQILSEREKMSAEMARLKSEVSKQSAPPPPIAPSTMAEVKTYKSPTVQVITAETAIRAGLPKLTTFANVVTGIIKDCDANLLPGVLVTVRDKEGVPLRALKTNKLGQFAASTPLPDETYILEVEDPRNRYIFDKVQIALKGTVLPAVEIVAKSLKEISREKLAKEIFGHQNVT